MRLYRILSLLLLPLLRVPRSRASPIDEEIANPPILRLVFRNDSTLSEPAEIGSPRNHTHQNIPFIDCLGAAFPEDVLCNVTELLRSDSFAPSMKIQYVTVDTEYPGHENETCGFLFFTPDEKSALFYEKIECGLKRDRPETSMEIEIQGLDHILRDFAVRNVIELSVVSVAPGFACRYRFKPYKALISAVKTYYLDSYYCVNTLGSFDFGEFQELIYPLVNFYKHDGENWVPQGTWPDYY